MTVAVTISHGLLRSPATDSLGSAVTVGSVTVGNVTVGSIRPAARLGPNRIHGPAGNRRRRAGGGGRAAGRDAGSGHGLFETNSLFVLFATHALEPDAGRLSRQRTARVSRHGGDSRLRTGP